MSNRLSKESSPYLRQHAENPVDWYPWCEEAFERAKEEDKPIFLSIGYSTCHWCHVMAHESFESETVAKLLNRDFISIKVDREERPDIDSIYMAVCQAFTGSGGWPTSIFMTPEQKPFFAGTYFPKRSMEELLLTVREIWNKDRESLLRQADEIVDLLNRPNPQRTTERETLLQRAVEWYHRAYDRTNGGFGHAPKFPAPHNLLFLLTYGQRKQEETCLEMAEQTLRAMHRGGMFDHVGWGFCRYSTDEKFLVPHFEKMLYDNALLILAYSKAYEVTGTDFYREVAEQTAAFVLREMTSPDGGFYSAWDADSEGKEGIYYLFTPQEINGLLGEENGEIFNRYYGITGDGNFEGKNIPNILHDPKPNPAVEPLRQQVEQYRKERHSLHLDDKILTSWNCLMIAALCRLHRATGAEQYLTAAKKADRFLMKHLWEDGGLSVSFRDGKRGVGGFLDDYAAYIFALLALRDETLDPGDLDRAKHLCRKVFSQFRDPDSGGFYLNGADQSLILRPKETYDGAIPSGNSLMAWNLVHLSMLSEEEPFTEEALKQLDVLSKEAADHPSGHSMFLLALLDQTDPPMKITAVLGNSEEKDPFPPNLPSDTLRILRPPSKEFPLKNGRTTYYACRGTHCLPPVNQGEELFRLGDIPSKTGNTVPITQKGRDHK